MADYDRIQTANRQIRRITNVGIAANAFLSAVKMAVGLLSGSMALFADGVHSLSDMATDLAVLVGLRFSTKGPDSKHPYGHSFVETFVAVFVGIVLATAGLGIIYRAAGDIAAGSQAVMGVDILLIALLSVAIKEVIYYMTRRYAVKLHSSMLYANAWHHRTDSLSSMAVAAGFIFCKFGLAYADAIVAILVGTMILMASVKVLLDSAGQITQRSVDLETKQKITEIITSAEQIRQFHKLRTRTVGRELFLDLHILVDADLTITQAHQIAENLEQNLHAKIDRPVNITVHIEPDEPALRKPQI